MRGREGDFLEIFDGSIFEVKGLLHPPDRLVAYPRYVVDVAGDRVRGSIRYRKVYSFEERFEFLKRSHPELLVYDPVFGVELPEVDVSDVKFHFRPQDGLQGLRGEGGRDEAERLSVEFSGLLQSCSNVDSSAFGVSGSILIGLQTPSSDIDVTVYGRENGRRVREALASLMSEGSQVRRLTREDLLRLYSFRVRDTAMELGDFLRHEGRKTFQGRFEGRDFFVRYVPDWDEVGERYGDRRYSPSGYVKITAEVSDSSQSLFTPCRYLLRGVEVLEGVRLPDIREVVSFRGRFCEQAEGGETIIAQGKAEKVVEAGDRYHRVVVGEGRSHCLISLTLMRTG